MKRQEILDAVTMHAKKMNMQCNRDGGNCAYRGSNGKMCLIGSLIKDEFYTRDLDDDIKTADEPEVILALQKSGVLARGKVPKTTKEFLERMQCAHDALSKYSRHSAFRAALKWELQKVADEYKLKLNW